MSEIFASYGTVLQKNPLFHEIPQAELPCVLEKLNAHIRQYKKEETIRHFGDPVNFIGIVLEGDIHILQDDYYGNRSITASVSAGALFAEAFACAGITELPATIVAATDCRILTVSSHALLQATDETWAYHTILIRNLLGIVARKNMYLNRKLKYTSHKTTAEKLLAYLNDQAKEKGTNAFYIPFNRQQLADYLGVERSAMSAEISKLASLGLIETRRSYFKLLKL